MTQSNLIAGLLTVIFLALFWTVSFQPDHSWSWDESMNAALPAARILAESETDGLRGGAQVLVSDCQQYPFVVPLYLAFAQKLFGVSELVTRVASRLLFCFGLFGLFLLAFEVVRSLRRGAPDLAWPQAATETKILFGALAFGACCPLAFGVSGTLFLETGFLTAQIFCLRAWLRRDAAGVEGTRLLLRDLAAGCWLCVCFFTKFNYACLLFAALGIDLLFQAWRAGRDGSLSVFFKRVAWLALPLFITLLWWFVWPWPGNGEIAAQHREAFVTYLSGNSAGGSTPWSLRLLSLSVAFVPTVRFGLLLIVGLALALRFSGNAAVRLMWLVTGCFAIPIGLHPFHLDRFLIPIGPSLWILSALGLGLLVERACAKIPNRTARYGLGFLVLAVCLAFPARDARFMAKRVGIWNEGTADYLTWLFAGWRDLSPSRSLRMAGLPTGTANSFMELVASELGDTERFGWLGVSAELSPAAIQLGLAARRTELDSAETFTTNFRRDAHRQAFLAHGSADIGMGLEPFREWAEQFDVIFHTDPPDLKARKSREWIRDYVDRLESELGWNRRELGQVQVDRPFADPITVTLFACSPPRQ